MKFNGREIFYPVQVDYGILSSQLKQAGGVVEGSPSTSSIASYGDTAYYLDNRLGWLEQIAADYRQRLPTLQPTVYARAVQDGAYIAIEYWYYYAFNNGPINDHEGDWELVVVLINNGVPESAVYSQHNSAERVGWGEVDKVEGTHPVVYVGRGSHANYFRTYEGKLGAQNDDVGGDGLMIMPQQFSIVTLSDAASDSQNPWLRFGGKWGEVGGTLSGILGGDGPSGPAVGDHTEAWSRPVQWALAKPVTGGMWFILSWILVNILLFFCIYLIIRTAFKVMGIIKTAKGPGLQVKKLLGSVFTVPLIMGIAGTALVLIGMGLPWFGLGGDIQSREIVTNGPVELMKFNGVDGLQVNTLQKGKGMTTVFNFAIPIGVLLLSGVIFMILDIIGAKSGKSLGIKYLLSGILPVIYFVMIIVGIASMGAILPGATAGMTPSMPPDSAALISKVAGTPFGGVYQGPLGGYAMLDLKWGIGIGAYLLLFGGILRIIGGIAMMAASPKVADKRVPKAAAAPQQHVVVFQTAQVAQAAPGHPTCPKCGAKAEPGDTFCENCGARVKA